MQSIFRVTFSIILLGSYSFACKPTATTPITSKLSKTDSVNKLAEGLQQKVFPITNKNTAEVACHGTFVCQDEKEAEKAFNDPKAFQPRFAITSTQCAEKRDLKISDSYGCKIVDTAKITASGKNYDNQALSLLRLSCIQTNQPRACVPVASRTIHKAADRNFKVTTLTRKSDPCEAELYERTKLARYGSGYPGLTVRNSKNLSLQVMELPKGGGKCKKGINTNHFEWESHWAMPCQGDLGAPVLSNYGGRRQHLAGIANNLQQCKKVTLKIKRRFFGGSKQKIFRVLKYSSKDDEPGKLFQTENTKLLEERTLCNITKGKQIHLHYRSLNIEKPIRIATFNTFSSIPADGEEHRKQWIPVVLAKDYDQENCRAGTKVWLHMGSFVPNTDESSRYANQNVYRSTEYLKVSAYHEQIQARMKEFAKLFPSTESIPSDDSNSSSPPVIEKKVGKNSTPDPAINKRTSQNKALAEGEIRLKAIRNTSVNTRSKKKTINGYKVNVYEVGQGDLSCDFEADDEVVVKILRQDEPQIRQVVFRSIESDKCQKIREILKKEETDNPQFFLYMPNWERQ